MSGRDKGLLEVCGRPMIAWTLERLSPQVGNILINANRSIEDYGRFGRRVIGDSLEGFQGPLAGLQASFTEAREELLLCVPCDAPLLPEDLVRRLFDGMQRNATPIAVAEAGGRLHSLHALFRTSLAEDLERALQAGERKPDRWYAECGFARVAFDDCPEAFENINTPEQLMELERRLHEEDS